MNYNLIKSGGGDRPSALLDAIHEQNYSRVYYLISSKKKLRPYITSNTTHQVFLVAVRATNSDNKLAIIKFLVDHGVNINGTEYVGNAIDNLGDNRGGIYGKKFQTEVLLYLLKLKIDPYIPKTNFRSYPLFQSIESGDINATVLFLTFGKKTSFGGIDDSLKLAMMTELERISAISYRYKPEYDIAKRLLSLDFLNRIEVGKLADELVASNKILPIVGEIMKNPSMINDIPEPELPDLRRHAVAEPVLEEVEAPKPLVVAEPVLEEVEAPKPLVVADPVLVEAPKPLVVADPVLVEAPKPLVVADPVVEVEAPKPSRSSLRAPTIPVDVVDDGKNKFELIQETLAQFGLAELILEDKHSIVNYYIGITSDLTKNADKIGIFTGDDRNLEFSRTKSSGEKFTQKFTFKKYLAEGSFNKTMIYKSGSKEYIIRKSVDPSMENQYLSFYENIKHIILYVLIRKYIGKTKFIPKPYFIGFKISSTGRFEILFVMEKGEMTVEDYVKSIMHLPYYEKDVTKLFFKIYKSYNELLKLNINFKHSDFKLNNIVVTRMNNPLIIDFGFSTFEITDAGKTIQFNAYKNGPTGRVHVTLTKYPQDTKYGYNLVHDMLQLISSMLLIRGFNPYNIFVFKKNLEYILNGHYTRWFLDAKTYASKDSFRFFYKDIDLIKSESSFFLSDRTPIKLYITPEELAESLELDVDEISSEEETFEKKYLKYKSKYLQLKKSLN